MGNAMRKGGWQSLVVDNELNLGVAEYDNNVWSRLGLWSDFCHRAVLYSSPDMSHINQMFHCCRIADNISAYQ